MQTDEHFKESNTYSNQESKLKWNAFFTFQIGEKITFYWLLGVISMYTDVKL